MKKIYVLLFLVCSCFGISAQTIADYLAAPFPSQLIAAPNGNAIAWVFNSQGERNIFYAEAPGYRAVQLTQYQGDEGIEVSQLSFTPNGKTMVYTRGNGNNPNGEPANPAQLQVSTARKIYSIAVHGGEPRLLAQGSAPVIAPNGEWMVFQASGQVWFISLTDTATKPKVLFTARGSVGQLTFSPNGEWLAFSSNRDDHAFIGLYQMERKTLQYAETSLDIDAYPSWSPDGKYLAYLRIPNIHNLLPFTPIKRANPWSIRVLDMATLKAKEIFSADTGIGSVMVDDVPAIDRRLWWAGPQQIIFPWEKNGWMQLYAVNAQSKAITHITPGEGEVETVQNTFSKTGLFYTSNIGNINRRAVWYLDFATLKPMVKTGSEIISWAGAEINNGFAFLQSSGTQPAWPAIQWNDGTVRPIAKDLFPAAFPTALVAPQAVKLTAKDGFVSSAQILLPPNHQPGKKHPAVIFLHGGSRRQMLLGFNYSQYYSNAYALQQYFAAKGYVALTLNYRSGIGYGIQFREADNYGAAGASEVNDVMAAANYLAQRNDVDASKIIPWGGSYGGFLTAHALAQFPDFFLGGVDIHGVHNWNNDIPVFAPWYQPEKFPEMARLAFQSSPMNYVQQWKKPVLLIHGDDDRNVLFSESVELAEVLRKQGVAVSQLVLPDEVHSFLLHRNWLMAYQATFNFIEQLVKQGK